MSIGEDRVRVTFNPSATGIVDQIKQKTADLINDVEALREGGSAAADVQRLVSLAQTAYEEASMWAVKAATAGK